MARWGLGDLADELAGVRALRADPPALAADHRARRAVFGAALQQFEELVRAADVLGPATSPISLFYALSQAGRAVAAARVDDDRRWQFTGHGARVTVPGRRVGEVAVGPDGATTGALQVLAEAVGSEALTGPAKLAELWASLPGIERTQGLGADHMDALVLSPVPWDAPEPLEAEIRVPEANWSDEEQAFEAFRQRMSHYQMGLAPTVLGRNLLTVEGAVSPIRVEWRDHDGVPSSTNLIGETYLGGRHRYLRPTLGERGDRLSIFMTWWAVLLALSSLARYHPATWTKAIDPDRSALTVPLEKGLRLAKDVLPQLVVHALTDRWAVT
jgi:hypothetical protein